MPYTDSVQCSVGNSQRLMHIMGTGVGFPYCSDMESAAEYQLKADNYAAAAQVAMDVDRRLELMRLSAVYRNKALHVHLGRQAHVLRRCPFSREQLRPY